MAIFRDAHIEGVGGGNFKVLVKTSHETKRGKVFANTAIHDQVFARRIGGVRFVRGAMPEHLTEVGELAEAMTWKSPLSGLPADGEKTVVYCPNELPNREEMAEVLAAHLSELKVADPGVIFGPDINCNEAVMERLAHHYGEGDHVSGLPQGKGGLSIDGQGYTARGLEAALLSAAGRLKWDLGKMTATIQGFGAVGAHIANNLSKHGVAVHAVSTAHGALIATSREGLDIESLFAAWKKGGDEVFKVYERSQPSGARFGDRDEIWLQEADIFIPAARTDVLAMPDEIQEMQVGVDCEAMDVVRFWKTTGIRVVLEGANHPLTDAAEKFLESKGVFVLPDYLVNCGGLIGCWVDWVYRQELESQSGQEWEDRLDNSALQYIAKIVERNVSEVLDFTSSRSRGIRQSTSDLARKRREELVGRLKHLASSEDEARPGRMFARACMDALLG